MPPMDPLDELRHFAASRPLPPSQPSAGRYAWLTPGEIAAELGVTPRTVRNWCHRGWLHCTVLASGHRRIPASAYEVFLAGGSLEAQIATASPGGMSAAELDDRVRRATSPAEVIALIMGEGL